MNRRSGLSLSRSSSLQFNDTINNLFTDDGDNHYGDNHLTQSDDFDIKTEPFFCKYQIKTEQNEAFVKEEQGLTFSVPHKKARVEEGQDVADMTRKELEQEVLRLRLLLRARENEDVIDREKAAAQESWRADQDRSSTIKTETIISECTNEIHVKDEDGIQEGDQYFNTS